MFRIPQEDLKFLRVLGNGCGGEVILAESKTFGNVVVKNTQLDENEQIFQDFLKEAELLSKMNSTNIISYFGTSRNKEGECIVMEFAVNGSLFHLLELFRKKNLVSTFSWDKRYQMAQDITRGLILMHSKGILHRDLKSLNILLDQNMIAKVSDFGLSKIKTKSQTTSSSLQKNVFGSLLWKAPETFSIRNQYTDKADIYSLGIIFWEIATCQVPYDGFDAETIKDSVKSGERLGFPSTCPIEFIQLIEQCWSQNPKDRPNSADVFDKISQLNEQFPKNDSKYITSSAPQFSGSISDQGISFLDMSTLNNKKQILSGSSPNRLVTENQFAQVAESEIEREIRMTKEKLEYLLREESLLKEKDQKMIIEKKENLRLDKVMMEKEETMQIEKKKREEEERNQEKLESFLKELEEDNLRIEKELKEHEARMEIERKIVEDEKRKHQEKQERILEEIEKENLRIEKEIKENEARMEIERKKREEEERKQKENEWIKKWKSTKAPDFNGDIFEAAKDGKLTSIIYLLANGININLQDNLDNGWHKSKYTALHYASRYGHLSIVEYLVNQKADLNAKDKWVTYISLLILLFIWLL